MENTIREIVEKVLMELNKNGGTYSDENLSDIGALLSQDEFYVPSPNNKEAYLDMKSHTVARLGVWRAGPRYKTESSLRFRADHASARDAVLSYVSEDLIAEMGFIPVTTKVKDKDEYITRPDLGRLFDENTKTLLREKLPKNPKVQLAVGDGLSSSAIEANIKNVLPAIAQGLKIHGIDLGAIPFIKHSRVNIMDQIGEITNADVVCILIGERPGLATAESMSAYMAYRPTENMPDARRNVISNIHKNGTPASEAGAYIADLLKLMLDKQMSGVGLR